MNIITNLDNASRSGYDDIPITIIQSLINILCRRIYYLFIQNFYSALFTDSLAY